MRKPGIVFVIGILLFCCIAGAASAQTIFRITNDTVDQQVSAASDDRIIWQDNRTGDFDVYIYNVTSDEIIQIQINDSDQLNPAIQDDLVVWQDNRSGYWDIVLFNLTSDEELRFSENESDQVNPAVTDGWIAWQGNQTGNWDIYLYNITDNETLQVTDNESDELDPVLSPNLLAWNDNSTGYWDIYVYPLEEEAPPPERPEPVIPTRIVIKRPFIRLNADFSANVTEGVAPLAVAFSDTSRGSPEEWEWDFGDGNTSTDENPVYVYPEPGNYTVTLEVTRGRFSDTGTKEDFITVREPVEANFTANVTNGTAPLTVQFNDTSTGTPEEWQWDFGDGNTSAEQDPVHVYAGPGNYTVTLEAINEFDNDTEVKEDYIMVEGVAEPLFANFTTNVTSGTAPLAVQFNDTSEGSPTSSMWDFGDGNTSAERDPVHVYVEPGNYTVSLEVTNETATDTITREDYITVEATAETLSANFTSNVTSGAAPLAVQFNDTSTGEPEAWEWDFGDGNTSTEQNPTYVYEPGTYTVNLTVSNEAEQDTETQTNLITVEESGAPGVSPEAGFTANQTTGTAPLGVAFTDTSTGEPETWQWDFGDGNTSTEQNPMHAYLGPGTYTVNLTVSNPAGQDTESQPDLITVEELEEPLSANFTTEPTAGAAPLEVAFNDTSLGSPDSWQWDFGDGNTSTDQNPTHVYTAPGTYMVTLTVGLGSSSSTDARLVTVI